MQALVNDIAERLRPIVRDMVKHELSNTDADTTMRDIAANIDLEKLVHQIDLSDLAEQIDLSDLAEQIDLTALADEIELPEPDMETQIKSFFSDNSFTISP